MKLKNIYQPFKTKQFFDECVNSSMKQINVQKQFMLSVHELCKKFSEDLQHLHRMMSVAVDDEETLSQNTTLSNYVVSISQIIKTRSEILYEEAIEPFQQFEDNYNSVNSFIDKNYSKMLENLKASNDLLRLKALDYYEGKNKIFSQDSSEQQYRISINQMNSLWEQFFTELPQYFEQFQLNEEARLTVTEQTYVKFIEAIEYMFQNPGKITIEKLHDSFERQRQQFKNKDLYHELCISSKKMIDFMNEPKCEMFTSKDDYFRNQAAELLQEQNQFNQDDIKQLKVLIEKPNDSAALIIKIKSLQKLNFREREDILFALQSKNAIYLSQYQQTRIFQQLIIKLFKYFEEDFNSIKYTSKFVNQALQILCVGLTLRDEQGKSLISGISRNCDILYSQRLWTSIYEELLISYNLQKQMIDATSNFVTFLHTPNSKLQLPKELPNDSIFNNIFNANKTRKISPTESLNIVNLILISTNLAPHTTSSIIMEIARSIQMKPSNSIPFIELQEANQMLKEFKPQIRHKHIVEKIGKWKNKAMYCFLKSLKYLEFNENYLNVIIISKEFSKTIKTKMIRYFLVSQKKLELPQRVKLWSELLSIDLNFYKIVDNYQKASKKLTSQIERSIVVDIKRSFSIDYEKREEIMNLYEHKLEMLLRLHAFDNPEISYYQGMNMLMVYLLFVTNQNEEQSFKLFRALLDKMLRDIFLEGLKSMRLHFYILDRLIAIFIPRLFIHWKQLQIESPQFATAWYVTLFTHSINLSSIEGNEVCFDIFDLIVARGWTGFYKAAVGLLKFYEKQLLELDFDQSQKFLNNMARTQFYRTSLIDAGFEQIPTFKNAKETVFPIKKVLISELEREYYHLREKIDQINLNHF